VVRINDRGPFVDGREIDLSYSVARRLGMEDRGVARLRIELLEVPQRR
jgi:rare lipoprotein A